MNSIQTFLHHELTASKTPSVQYAFFDTDSTIYSFREGLIDIKDRKLVEYATTYNLFSITKTFTALAVLQLVQTGELALKSAMKGYLPSFPYGAQVTIEQVLQHTAGIPNPLPLRWTHLISEHQNFNRDLFFARIFENNSQLKFTPGTKFSYSNLGYILLGQLIEQVTGNRFETYIKEQILDKLSLPGESLDFKIDPLIHAKGYQAYFSFTNLLLGLLIDKKKFMVPREQQWKPFRNFYVNGTPYGGMIGSINGLTRYAQAILLKDTRLLNGRYWNLLFDECKIGNRPTGMSLSWFTGTLKGNTYFAHAGGGGGYYVELRVYPELGIGSTILYNRSGLRDERMLDKADTYFITEKKSLG